MYLEGINCVRLEKKRGKKRKKKKKNGVNKFTSGAGKEISLIKLIGAISSFCGIYEEP